jgi:hypothetical protein
MTCPDPQKIFKDTGKAFDFSYDPDNGRFDFSLFGKALLGTQITVRIGKERAEIVSHAKKKSTDGFGAHIRYTLRCRSAVKEKRTFTCTMKAYSRFVIFETVNHFAIKGKKNKYAFGTLHQFSFL